MSAHLMAEKAAERLALYQQGLSDKKIAKIQCVYPSTITYWRKAHGLQAHHVLQHCEVSEEQRVADYRAGLNDGELAARWGVRRLAAREWRKRRGLSPNAPRSGITDEKRAARMLLYSFGYTDVRIAREQGVHDSSVQLWRSRLGLPPNARPGTRKRAKVERPDKRLLDRIKAALPLYLSPADRDDAASDLLLAVISGEIPIEEIERQAKTFGNKVIDQYASKFGPRSLDAEISDDGDGFAMIDMIRDDSHSSWLEEMGATAW